MECHPVNIPHHVECCVEIAEYKVASKEPENDPGCGTDSFALENPPEKANDLPEHDGAALRDLTEWDRDGRPCRC